MVCSAIVTVISNSALDFRLFIISQVDAIARAININCPVIYVSEFLLKINREKRLNYFFFIFNFLCKKNKNNNKRKYYCYFLKKNLSAARNIQKKELLFLYIAIQWNGDHYYSAHDICAWWYFLSVWICYFIFLWVFSVVSSISFDRQISHSLLFASTDSIVVKISFFLFSLINQPNQKAHNVMQ